jgi:hypothetical protein
LLLDINKAFSNLYYGPQNGCIGYAPQFFSSYEVDSTFLSSLHVTNQSYLALSIIVQVVVVV